MPGCGAQDKTDNESLHEIGHEVLRQKRGAQGCFRVIPAKMDILEDLVTWYTAFYFIFSVYFQLLAQTVWELYRYCTVT
jgi:hypothetical protein